MTADDTSRNAPHRTDLPAGRRPIHPILVSFSAACFAGAFVTDIVYWRTVAVTWETFSDWLITVGLILAGCAVLAFVIDVFRGRRTRALAWPLAVGYVLAVLVSLLNAFVHSRDAYTAVVPTGLALSGLTVVVLLFSAWIASTWAYRPRIGAST